MTDKVPDLLAALEASILAARAERKAKPLLEVTVPEPKRFDGAVVTIGKNQRGTWCVFVDGRVLSDHGTRDGAVAAYRNIIRASGVTDDE